MNKYILEFTLTGEGSITAESEEAAQAAVKKILKSCADQLGTELARHSELVHIVAPPLHTLRIIKEKPQDQEEAKEKKEAEPESVDQA